MVPKVSTIERFHCITQFISLSPSLVLALWLTTRCFETSSTELGLSTALGSCCHHHKTQGDPTTRRHNNEQTLCNLYRDIDTVPRVLLHGLRQHLQLNNHCTTQVTAMHPCVQEDSRSAVVDCVHSGVEKKAVMVYIYVALLDLYNYWQSITSKSLRHLCTIKTLNCSRRCCNPLTYCSGTLFNCMDRVSA